MSRSLKKGPFIEPKLLKRIEAMNQKNEKKVIRTWSRAALPVFKLVESAVANAEENFGVSRDDLFIAKITADEAPTQKWRRFGARGRFKPILRRSSHLTIILRERGA